MLLTDLGGEVRGENHRTGVAIAGIVEVRVCLRVSHIPCAYILSSCMSLGGVWCVNVCASTQRILMVKR